MHHCNGGVGLSLEKCMAFAMLSPRIETCIHPLLNKRIGSTKQIGTHLTQHNYYIVSVRLFSKDYRWPYIDIVNALQFIRTSITTNTGVLIHPPPKSFSLFHTSPYILNVRGICFSPYIRYIHRRMNYADYSLDILLLTLKFFCNRRPNSFPKLI